MSAQTDDSAAKATSSESSQVRYTVDTHEAKVLREIPEAQWVRLTALVPQPHSWIRVEATSAQGKVLAIAKSAYPNHHACVLRNADEWVLGWFRGQANCTLPDEPLHLKGVRELRLLTELPKKKIATPVLYVVWGDKRKRASPRGFDKLSGLAGTDANGNEHHGEGSQTGNRKRQAKRRNPGLKLDAFLEEYGDVEAIGALVVADAEGQEHKLPVDLFRGESPARLKQNRKGQVSLRWTDSSGREVRIRNPRELRITVK